MPSRAAGFGFFRLPPSATSRKFTMDFTDQTDKNREKQSCKKKLFKQCRFHSVDLSRFSFISFIREIRGKKSRLLQRAANWAKCRQSENANLAARS